MAKEKPAKKDSYGADAIQVLEGLEAVRRRPGMYIGTTGVDGLHHLIWEVFDNSRDEAMGGHANDVEVAILPGNRIRVADNGRGIPVEIHPKTKVSTLETVLTVLHAGGKFGGEGYKYSGGLHGVGVSVVNALSTHVRAEVHRDGGRHVQEYKNGGKPVGKTQRLGPSKRRGTVITFTPDPSIFPEIVFDIKTITNHLRRQAYLVPGMRITVIDAREFAGKLDDTAVFYLREAKLELTSNAFYFEGGIRSLIAFQNRQLQLLHKNIFYVQKEVDNVLVEVALQYVDDISSRISAYANNIYNPEGGTHVTGFKTALTRSLNTYLKKSGAKSEEAFTGDDVLEGLTAVVSVKLREIQFEGQTKAKLGSVEARGAVDTVFAEGLAAFLEEHPEDAKAMVNKAILAMRARKAAKAAKDSILRKGALEGLTLPGKLADCQTNRAEESELFIVEGDSAGGSSKQGRDRRTQAILPLRGKILNVERARLDRMLASEEIKNLVVAMGTGIGDMFNIEKLRYHKIIIATDADVDGAHIRTLLMTLFYRHFPKVMEGGFLYIAQPPLFKITKGKEVFYAYNDAERLAVTGDIKIEEVSEVSEEEEPKEEVAEVKRSPKLMVQRYKGLGEMNPEELWETTMDPQRRVLKQVTIADAESANKVFDMLMGTDVSGRKTFIQSHATEATLDV
jgi:DNA gyrase subunit B